MLGLQGGFSDNVVAPGINDTVMAKKYFTGERIKQLVPMKRASRDKDVAAVILSNPVNKGMGSSLWQVFRILLYVAMMVAGKLFSSKGTFPALQISSVTNPTGTDRKPVREKRQPPVALQH